MKKKALILAICVALPLFLVSFSLHGRPCQAINEIGIEGTIETPYRGGRIQQVDVKGITLNDTTLTSPEVKFQFVNASGQKVTDKQSLTFDATNKWHKFNVSVASLPNGLYGLYIEVVSIETGNQVKSGNSTTSLDLFNVSHVYYFEEEIFAYYDDSSDTVQVAEIKIATSYTGPGYNEKLANATTAQYCLLDAGGDLKATGDLIWIQDSSTWATPGIEMAWQGQGNFTLEVTFQFPGSAQVHMESDTFQRFNQSETIIVGIIITIIVLVAVVVTVVVIMKRRGTGLEKYEKSVKKKKRDIKVLEISSSDIKKAKRGKLPDKKKAKEQEKTKGRTKESNDLIFSVPQWEVDELDEEETETQEEETGSEQETTVPGDFTYNLHCPGCNSWYQVEDFTGQKCPECKTNLAIAVWCTQCEKWFDVPTPGEYSCPLCDRPLNFKK